jgi:hypothetical protein
MVINDDSSPKTMTKWLVINKKFDKWKYNHHHNVDNSSFITVFVDKSSPKKKCVRFIKKIVHCSRSIVLNYPNNRFRQTDSLSKFYFSYKYVLKSKFEYKVKRYRECKVLGSWISNKRFLTKEFITKGNINTKASIPI